MSHRYEPKLTKGMVTKGKWQPAPSYKTGFWEGVLYWFIAIGIIYLVWAYFGG